jgi:uncharacterized protein (TIRG00374 family)
MKRLSKLFSSYVFNVTLIIVLAVLVFWLTVKDDPQKVLSLLRHASIGWLLVIVLIEFAIRALVGWTIKKECNLSHPRYTWWQGFVNSLVAGLFNGVTPGASGGQFAQAYIFKKQGVPLHHAASVLWMDFIIYQSTMVVSVFVLILLRFQHFYEKYSQFFAIVLLGFAVSSAVIVGLWALVRFPKFYTWLTTKGFAIGVKIHLIKDPEKARKSVDAQLKRFGEEVIVLRTHRELIPQVAGGHFLRLMLYYSVPFFCAKALHIPVQMSQMIDILALSSFVEMINAFVPLPGSSGGAEATFLLMFSTIFGTSNTGTIMLLWRICNYYFVLIIGFIGFVYAKKQPDILIEHEDDPEEKTQQTAAAGEDSK